MKLDFIKVLGDGAFADVWQAKDELDREVAVKIIRPANVGVADALSHAKALARASHKNVVKVITLEKAQDPNTNEEVDCVVMELLEGITLSKRLSGEKLTLEEIEKIGIGVIEGLLHIHDQNMVHGDLHLENVMVLLNEVKIIDILYLNSLAIISTETKESRLKRDLLSLRILLNQLLTHSITGSAEATEFNNLLEADATCKDMLDAFLEITSPQILGDDQRKIDHAFSRITDSDYIKGESYAAALDEETITPIILPLLKKLANEKVYESKHVHYVQAIWSRLPAHQRAEFLKYLSDVIDRETPKGRWAPGIRLLISLRSEGWEGLTKFVQVRLEALIVKDVLAGHKDIHSNINLSGGALGTYSLSLWKNFTKPEELADNLISLLRQSWYTQNYVGNFLIQIIPELSNATGRREEFIEAIRISIRNDARIVVNKIENLPKDWVEDIRRP